MRKIMLLILLITVFSCNDSPTSKNNVMIKPFKPEGHNSVSPYICANNPNQLLNFINKVFRAKQLSLYENADGSLVHAELLIDDSVIMLSGASENFPATQSLIHVFVPDVVETFGAAVENGAISIQEPTVEEGDTDMRGMFCDMEENIWAIATHNYKQEEK